MPKRENAVYVERVVTFSIVIEPITELCAFLTHLTYVVITTTTTVTSTGSDQMRRMLIEYVKMNLFLW